MSTTSSFRETAYENVVAQIDSEQDLTSYLNSNEQIDKNLIGRNIKRIGNYINSSIKLEFKCLLCNHEWLASTENIFHKTHQRGCPLCL